MIQAFGLTSEPRKELPPALDDVSFEARPGRVTVLLGTPGAGKTTALRLMLELQQGCGITYFRGRPLHRVAHPAREVGVLLGDVPGHPGRTVRGHLRMLCAAAGVPARRADEVLEAVGLVSLREERLGTLSRGMDRRLGLACALLADPHSLVLDEPAEGLSERESRWLHGMLRAHADHGGTVLSTTTDPKEAIRIADRVVTLDEGRLVADQEVGDFARTRLRPRVAVRSPHAARLAALLTKEARTGHRSVEVVQEDGNRLSVYGSTCAAVGDTAFRHGVLVHQLADEVGDMGPGAGAADPELAELLPAPSRPATPSTARTRPADDSTGAAATAAQSAARTDASASGVSAADPADASVEGVLADAPIADTPVAATAESLARPSSDAPSARASAPAVTAAPADESPDARPDAATSAPGRSLVAVPAADAPAATRPSGASPDETPAATPSTTTDADSTGRSPDSAHGAIRPPAQHSPRTAARRHPGGRGVTLPPPISVRPAPSPLRPLRYELRRAAGVGTGFVTGAVVLLLSAVTAVFLARAGHTSQARLLAAWPVELPLPPAALGAGLLGALAFGDEFRHPALAADRGTVPRRLGMLTAKLAVAAFTALALAFLTVGCDAEVLYLLYGREHAQVPADWAQLSVSWIGLVVGCAWAGVLAAGVFRSTTAGLAAVAAVPVVVVPVVHKVVHGVSVRTAAGLSVRMREVFLLQWPFGGERYLAAVVRVIGQPFGGALALSLTCLLGAYLLTTVRSRAR
ncbi:ATP-binding cassette domain-containing protein [Streptomyces sp. BK239]|uniref:ABC transporter ATP-binding protein n=1 Tax=Streptomyces sp. BK239 TaxID=2512155 RepID=UPI00102C2746|nr:ABC transporter ATP-binding protein [Streptomyces sp. BK239]RZU24168.1 ABC-type multidrug transport system ATPase subunit [Streptomyces sp. BK239]